MLTDEAIVYQFAEQKLDLVVPTSEKVVFTTMDQKQKERKNYCFHCVYQWLC